MGFRNDLKRPANHSGRWTFIATFILRWPAARCRRWRKRIDINHSLRTGAELKPSPAPRSPGSPQPVRDLGAVAASAVRHDHLSHRPG
jgi:hypothetical protein